mgnify:CR=1 FL=1
MTQAALNSLYEELKAQSNRKRCSKCKSHIWPAWNRGTWSLRCREGFDPDWESKPDWQAEQFSKILEKEAKMMQSQTPETTMLARVTQANSLGLFPDKADQAQLALIAKAALAYGLDPLLQELILYQGKPFITIDGRRRLDANAGHHPSIRFRILTTEEKEFYVEAGALNPGDLAHVCVLTTEHGNTVEAFGRVLAKQRDMNQKGANHLPTVQYTIEMSQKRAEARARRMAYGPSPRPALLDSVDILEEGDVVEGELAESQPPDPQQNAPARPPSRAAQPQPKPTAGGMPPAPVKPGDICDEHNRPWGRMPDRGIGHPMGAGNPWHIQGSAQTSGAPADATDSPSAEVPPTFDETPLGQLQWEVFNYGMSWPNFESMVLHMPWGDWIKANGTIAKAREYWIAWDQKQRRDGSRDSAP